MTKASSIETEIKYYSGIRETDVEWLWYPFIPYGKITLLQGDPGDGKSTFMLHLAASITTGGKLPDGTDPDSIHSVIYQCSEDNSSDTIKPRLLQAGADCDKVAYINEEKDPLTIGDERIEEAIVRTGSRLLILDPIQAYIPPDYEMKSATSMRSLMKKLAAVAQRNRCAVVLVGHMNKASGSKNLYRGFGSIDIAAITRSVLMIKRDEENPDIRYMFPVKTSLAHEGRAIRFIFSNKSGLQMLGPCNMEQEVAENNDMSATLGKSARTEMLLNELLACGDMPSKKLIHIFTEKGISERTVRTVAKTMGIKAVKKGSAWYWALP